MTDHVHMTAATIAVVRATDRRGQRKQSNERTTSTISRNETSASIQPEYSLVRPYRQA
jgi:hypothetical protein